MFLCCVTYGVLTRPCAAEPPFQLSGKVFLTLARHTCCRVERFPSLSFQHASHRFLDHFLGFSLATCANANLSALRHLRRVSDMPAAIRTLEAQHTFWDLFTVVLPRYWYPNWPFFVLFRDPGPFGMPGETNHSIDPPDHTSHSRRRFSLGTPGAYGTAAR